jgi:hypothetical protein
LSQSGAISIGWGNQCLSSNGRPVKRFSER